MASKNASEICSESFSLINNFLISSNIVSTLSFFLHLSSKSLSSKNLSKILNNSFKEGHSFFSKNEKFLLTLFIAYLYFSEGSGIPGHSLS